MRKFAVVGVGLLLSAAPGAAACGGMPAAGDCCAMMMADHGGGHAGDRKAPMPCHRARLAWDVTTADDCCDIGSSSAAKGASSSKSVLPAPVLRARQPLFRPAASDPGKTAPRTVFPRTHDPGLYTLLSSYLL